MIDDSQVPIRDLLLGPGADEVLGLAISESGGVLRSAKKQQVRYIPGSSITVQYEADVRWDGNDVRETFVVRSGADLPTQTMRLDIGGIETAIWRYPDDPYLPGLAAAANQDTVLDILRQLGVEADSLRLQRRTYRAGRRAVIEATSDSNRLFIKVVRPSRVERLQAIHQAVVDKLPVPHSYGWDADVGIIVIEALAGKTLRKAIANTEHQLPTGSELVAVLDRLPSIDGIEQPVMGPVARLPDHAKLISTVLPHLTGRLDRLATGIEISPEPEVAVHGDFHASQVITNGGRLTGLIDLDTMGNGERCDDLATMIGQISTLSLTNEKYRLYGESLINHFDQMVDPISVRHRTAAVVVGLATGPFRVQMSDWQNATEMRIDLAERWLESAQSG